MRSALRLVLTVSGSGSCNKRPNEVGSALGRQVDAFVATYLLAPSTTHHLARRDHYRIFMQWASKPVASFPATRFVPFLRGQILPELPLINSEVLPEGPPF